MNQIEATAVITGLFILRLGIPLALTLLFGIMMNRIMNREYLD